MDVWVWWWNIIFIFVSVKEFFLFRSYSGTSLNQRFRREKDGNYGKFIGSNFVIFCYKKFEKFALCKSVNQSEATFIVFSEPIENERVKINFS